MRYACTTRFRLLSGEPDTSERPALFAGGLFQHADGEYSHLSEVEADDQQAARLAAHQELLELLGYHGLMGHVYGTTVEPVS